MSVTDAERLENAAPDMFAALEAAREAMDSLFSRLIARSPHDDVFYPSKSEEWNTVLQINAALKKAKGG